MQHARGDLTEHGGGAVSELGGARREQIPAVGGHGRGGVGDVPTRGHGRDHRDRHALADGPAGRRGHAVAALEGGLGEIEALIESVTAPYEILVVAVVVGCVQWIAVADRVDAPQFERIDAEALRE